MQSQQSLFTSYIVAGVEALLARVRATEYVVPEADRQQAWHLLSFALKLAEAWPVTQELLLALAPKMELAGFREEWMPYLEKGLQRSELQHDQLAEGAICLQIGHLYQRLGNLSQAEHFVAKAVNLFVLLRKPSSHGAALNRLAEIVRQERKYEEAEYFTDSALASLADNDPAYGHTYLIKARIAFDQKQWNIAQKHFETAYSLSKTAKIKRREAVCIQNLGRISQIRKEYKQAVDYYENAITIFREINDSFNLAAVQMNLGVVYSLTNQPQQALQQYASAESIFAQLQDLRHLAKVQTNRGIEWYNLEQWQLSAQAFQSSADLWQQVGDQIEYANALDGLGMTHACQNNFEAAIQLFNHALTILQQLDYQDTFQNLVADIEQHLNDARIRESSNRSLSDSH